VVCAPGLLAEKMGPEAAQTEQAIGIPASLIFFCQLPNSNRKVFAFSDTLPSGVIAQLIQTKPNLSDSGATMHQKVTRESDSRGDCGVSPRSIDYQRPLKAHESEGFRLFGHFANRYEQ
jgi:hypothetical protein